MDSGILRNLIERGREYPTSAKTGQETVGQAYGVTKISTLAIAKYYPHWGVKREENYHPAFTNQAGFRLIWEDSSGL